MKTALSIAGSDSCGGAGIQADIKTMTMNGVYAMSAITALTAQNTTGVRSIMESTPEFLKDQIDAVFEDIRPDAVKIGMVASSELIKVIAERLAYYKAENVVVDPVMVATSGSELIKTDAVSVLTRELLPLALLLRPIYPKRRFCRDRPFTRRKIWNVWRRLSEIPTDALCFSRAVTASAMQMIFCMQTAAANGSAVSVSTIPTRTARAVRFRPP